MTDIRLWDSGYGTTIDFVVREATDPTSSSCEQHASKPNGKRLPLMPTRGRSQALQVTGRNDQARVQSGTSLEICHPCV